MLAFIIILTGIIAEAVALGSIFTTAISVDEVLYCLRLHIFASAMISLGLLTHIRHYDDKLKYFHITALVAFNLLLPLLAPLISIIIYLTLTHAVPEVIEVPIRSVDGFPSEEDITLNLSQLNPGSANFLLRSKNLLGRRRLEALFALKNSTSGKDNRLMREVLSDENDEIRLLAFGSLDEQEKKLNKKVNSIFQILEDADLTDYQRARYIKRLAFIYWEFIYRELHKDELQDISLTTAFGYASEALKILKDDYALWTLVGQIHLKYGSTASAEYSFQKAIKLNAQSSRVLPYLAEIYYNKRNYKSVKHLLESGYAFKKLPEIGTVIEFWNEKIT